MRLRLGGTAGLVLVALLVSAWAAASAGAYIYTTSSSATISTTNLDGSNPQTLTASSSDPNATVSATSIATDGSHFYFGGSSVGSGNNGTIARMSPDGTGLNLAFVTLPTIDPGMGLIKLPSEADAIALNSAYIYWADFGEGWVGRANIDGSSPNEKFIASAGNRANGSAGPRGVAINSSYIFWTNPDQNTIGRADINGGSPNNSFITGATDPTGIAVSGNDIYWINAKIDNTNGTIGHAQLDQSGNLIQNTVNQSFIGPFASYGDSLGITTANGYLYWVDSGGWIGRAAIDGSSPPVHHYLHAFDASGGGGLFGVAVDSGQANPTATSISCSPSPVEVLYPTPDAQLFAKVHDTTRCTATVRDTAASPRTVRGTVHLGQSPVEGGFGVGGNPGSSCTLQPSTVPGQSSCRLTYTTAADASGFVPHAKSTQITAAYGGETTHDVSNGVGTLALHTVRACHLVVPSEGSPYYDRICGRSSQGGGGAVNSTKLSIGGGSITAGFVPGCVHSGAKLAVHVSFTPGRSKHATFVKVSRADFSLGSAKPTSVRHAPFIASLKIPAGSHRGSKLTVTVRLLLQFKHHKHSTKTIHLTFVVC